MSNIPADGLPFLDNPQAPDIFADSSSGLFFFNGNIRITFEALRVNDVESPGPVSRVVIGRLVIPISSAESLANALLRFIEQQKAQTSASNIAQTPPTLN
jgi:hypothetical protein